MTASASPAKRRAASSPLLGPQPLVDRHEAGIEPALAQHPAHHARQAERHQESVRRGAGAEHGRDQHIPREAQHARQRRRHGDGQGGAGEGGRGRTR